MMPSAASTRAVSASAGVLALSVALPPTLDDDVDAIVIGFYVLTVALLAVALLAHRRIQGRKRLAAECRKLSGEILALKNRHDAHLPSSTASTYEADHHGYSAALLSDYDHHYAGRAVGLFDRLVDCGVADPNERLRYTNPTNPLGVRSVGIEFGAMAERL